MSALSQRGRAILAVIAVSLAFATPGLAQMPGSPWKKGAPLPEPDEELYGVAAGGKPYVIGGGGGQLRVRPGHRQVDEEEGDAAAGAPCGPRLLQRQDIRLRRLRPPGESP